MGSCCGGDWLVGGKVVIYVCRNSCNMGVFLINWVSKKSLLSLVIS
jgi:hypothetical protein